MKNIAVLKFGGTSVKNIQRLRHVASIVERKAKEQKIIVVVSAMGDTTDCLLQLAKQCGDEPAASELDVLLSTGEQVSIALLAILLRESGLRARSMTGAQAGILTDDRHNEADIQRVDTSILLSALDEYDVLVIAGFQGVTATGDITTLGRGGSDTTAVTLAAALDATPCEIFTDVDGIYDHDPNVWEGAVKYERLSFEHCLDLANNGAQVIHPRAVAEAKKHQLPVRVRSTFSLDDLGTEICSIA